jgi:hypothetical protein
VKVRRSSAPVAVLTAVTCLAAGAVNAAPADAGNVDDFTMTLITDPGFDYPFYPPDLTEPRGTYRWTDDEVVGSLIWQDGVNEAGARADNVEASVSGEAVDTYEDPYLVDLSAADGAWLEPGTYTRRQIGPGLAGLLVTHGSQCDSDRFEVLEADPVEDRLWVVFETHCDDARSSTFGEVRANVPEPYDDLTLSPSRAMWPPLHDGEAGPPVGLRLTNTGTLPQDLGSAQLSGDPGFRVIGTDCSVLAPGASCRVRVGFTPSKPGRHGAVLTVPRTGEETVTVPLHGSGIPGHTQLSMRGTVRNKWLLRDSYVDGGRGYFAVDAASYPFAGGVTFAGPEFEGLFVTEEGKDGAPLTPGRYRNMGSVDDYGSNPTCTAPRGTFTVHEIAYDAYGEVTKLRLDFRQVCGEATNAPIHGEIAWRSTDPVSPPPRVAVSLGPHTDDVDWRRIRFELQPGSGPRRVAVLAQEPRRPETVRVVDRLLLRPGRTVQRRIDPRGYELIFTAERRGGPIVSDGISTR